MEQESKSENALCKCATEEPVTPSDEKTKFIHGETFYQNMKFAVVDGETLIINTCKFFGSLEFNCFGTGSVRLSKNEFFHDVLIKKDELFVECNINYFKSVSITACDFFGSFECVGTEYLQLDYSSFHESVYIEQDESLEHCDLVGKGLFMITIVIDCEFSGRFTCYGTHCLQLNNNIFNFDVFIQKEEPPEDEFGIYEIKIIDCHFHSDFDLICYDKATQHIKNNTFLKNQSNWSSNQFGYTMSPLKVFFHPMFQCGVVILCCFLVSSFLTLLFKDTTFILMGNLLASLFMIPMLKLLFNYFSENGINNRLQFFGFILLYFLLVHFSFILVLSIIKLLNITNFFDVYIK